MERNNKEWFKQADYDMKTAGILFDNKRYIYAIFMCHLAIEKTLKGLYQERLKKTPPKVHNLIFLVEKIGLDIPDDFYDLIFNLNRVSIPTRYPEDIQKMHKDYNKKKTGKIHQKSKEVMKWLKTQQKR